MEEKTGRSMRPEHCLSLKRGEKLQNIQITTYQNQNKARRQTKGLYQGPSGVHGVVLQSTLAAMYLM